MLLTRQASPGAADLRQFSPRSADPGKPLPPTCPSLPDGGVGTEFDFVVPRDRTVGRNMDLCEDPTAVPGPEHTPAGQIRQVDLARRPVREPEPDSQPLARPDLQRLSHSSRPLAHRGWSRPLHGKYDMTARGVKDCRTTVTSPPLRRSPALHRAPPRSARTSGSARADCRDSSCGPARPPAAASGASGESGSGGPGGERDRRPPFSSPFLRGNARSRAPRLP